MLRPALRSAAAGHTNNQGYFWLTAKHIAKFSRAVDNQVAGEQAKVDRHQLEDGTQTAQSGADGRARNHLFRQRRIAHALLTKFLEEPLADGIGAAIPGDVFSHDKNALITQHLLTNRLAQCITICNCTHSLYFLSL